MKKLASVAAGLAVIPALAFVAPVFADSPGSFAGGAGTYQVRNVTQNGAYSTSVSTVCNDTVKYSVRLSNTDYGQITNVTVKAALSGQATVSGTASDGSAKSVTSAVTVTVPVSGTLSYVTGSTSLYTGSGTLIKNLSDGVTTTGVNAGTLVGSTTEFVYFQAKVNCATTPKTIQVCDLSTNKVVTINENQFDSSKYSKDLTKCQSVTPPSELPDTGAGQTIAMFGVATVVAAAAHRLFSRRQTR